MGQMKELSIVMKENGYETPDEQNTLLHDMNTYIPPWQVYTDEEHIKWTEFCRALQEKDFNVEDQLVLNGIHFIVKRVWY